MGLDQYLYGTIELDRRSRDEISDMIIRNYNLNSTTWKIDTELGYWRKANHIHQFFVSRLEGDVNDCNKHYFDVDLLTRLRELCESIMENKGRAELLLPTQDGFFFGSLEYDDYYYETTEYTIRLIKQLEEAYDEGKISGFAYQASW